MVEKYDSSYELARFMMLDGDPDVVEWTKAHGIRVPYRQTNRLGRARRRRYIPDILVKYRDGSVYLEEVKGHIWDPINFALKQVAATLYCVSRGWVFRVISEKDITGLPILERRKRKR